MLILVTLMACTGGNSDSDSSQLDTEISGNVLSLDELVPADDAVDVPVDTSFTAQFDQDLQSGEVTIGGVDSISEINADTLTARLSQPLDLLTSYTATFQGVTGTSGAAFPDIQTTFTSRDGVWTTPSPITESEAPTGVASAALGASVVVIITRADRTQAHSMTSLDHSMTVELDNTPGASAPMVAANGSEAVAVWLQDERLYTASGTSDAVWSDPTPLTESSFLIEPTSLAMTDDATVAVGWRSSSVRTRVATRVTGVWSEPVILGCATASECSHVALYPDHTGGLAAFIRGLTAEGKRIETSRFRTGEWTEPTVLFAVDGDISEPLAVFRDNETLAMWRVNNSDDAGMYVATLGIDDTWSDVHFVRESDAITALDVVPLADGTWIAVWVEDESTADASLFSLWVSGVEEDALTDPIRLMESEYAFDGVGVVPDTGGNLHLTWTEASEPSQLLTRRFNHRTGWEDAVPLATNAGTARVHVLPTNRANAVFTNANQLTTVFFE